MRLLDLHPTALAELRCPPSLPASALADLSGAGFCVVPGWLSAAASQAVLLDAMSCEAAGLPRRAGVGSTRHGATAVRQDKETRRSSMLPLYPPPRQSAGLVDVRLALSEAVRNLGAELEADKAQGLPAFSPFRTELAYLYYPTGGHLCRKQGCSAFGQLALRRPLSAPDRALGCPGALASLSQTAARSALAGHIGRVLGTGGHYLRHMDVPAARGGFNPLGRSEADGGSFSGAATRREISMLLYLNPSWDPAWGGDLRIFLPGEEGQEGQEGEEGEEGGETHIDVTPEAGTLARAPGGTSGAPPSRDAAASLHPTPPQEAATATATASAWLRVAHGRRLRTRQPWALG